MANENLDDEQRKNPPGTGAEADGPEEEVHLTLPELTPVARKRLERCFQFGVQKRKQPKPDHDYAHTMFGTAVQGDPANLKYVEAMFENLVTKFNANRKGGRSPNPASEAAAKAAIRKAVKEQKWPDVLKHVSDALAGNPWDAPTLRAIATACEQFHPQLNEVELKYLKMALDANPRDIDVNKHCAVTLARVGQYDQAIGCWRRIADLRGGDQEADRNIARLLLEKTRGAMGLEDESISDDEKEKRRAERAKTRKEAVKQADAAAIAKKQAAKPAAPPEEARPKIVLTQRQRLEGAIIENLYDMENYFLLADLHAKDGRERERVAVLQKAVNAAGGDGALQRQIIDYETRDLRRKVAAIEKKTAAEKTEENVRLVRKARATLNQKELELYQDRVERFPDSQPLRFELAIRNKRAGNFEQAIKLFTEVQEDEELKPVATLELGECQQHVKLYQKALQTYIQAVDLAKTGDTVEIRKAALYRAGSLAYGLKDYVKAEKYIGNLFEFDSEYRDCKALLDKIDAKRYKK